MTGTSQRFPDEVFVPGQGSDLARDLLDAAERLGFRDQTIRVSEQGFMVPARVAAAVAPSLVSDPTVDRRQLRQRDGSGRYLSKKGGS